MEYLITEIEQGFQTACVEYTTHSNLAYRPQFISNDYKSGRKVLTSIEQELRNCSEFFISVAFITMGGISPLLQTLRELESNGIPGKIITTNYLTFSEPEALRKLSELKNIELRMFQVEKENEGFHTKGYIFKNEEIYKIIIGSSNMTLSALTKNKEWNSKIVSTIHGEYTKDVIGEFKDLWEKSGKLNEWIDIYTQIYEEQRRIARITAVPTVQQYTLTPNYMQVSFIKNLQNIVAAGEKKAILISATGTGKTYASAFALRDMRPDRILFLVHREQIAKQAKASFRNVFGTTKTLGLISGSSRDYKADFIFSTMQMMSKYDVMKQFHEDTFDIIVIDEAHHSAAKSYQNIMNYFKPKFWLGMTASPDRRVVDNKEPSIYEIFDHNIAYEIRLQQALEENMLCPFHYFGITDLEVNGETFNEDTGIRNFTRLTSEERVKHIIKNAEYFGFCGQRVKGLVFCSRKEEGRKLSEMFNMNGYRTIFLCGDDSQETREEGIERLEQDQNEGAIDYIFTVDIFNEGVDIPAVNQVIMLRPTESPIVFIQQLGRGIRKYDDKEYVIILDFIANYSNNFMIPIALSGDRSYNKDTIRRYVMEGSRIIPGSSSIHFDEISKKRIFQSIDNANPNNVQFLKGEYKKLKDKIGRIPEYIDFEEHGAVDIMLFFENKSIGSYHNFLTNYEEEYNIKLTPIQDEMLQFVSQKIANGKRIEELNLLNRLLAYSNFSRDINEIIEVKTQNAVSVLTNEFISSENNKGKFSNSIFVERVGDACTISKDFKNELGNEEFANLLRELISFGIRRNQKFYKNNYKDTDFVLYEKYTYEDVCKLLNWEKNIVAQNIGGYKYDSKTNTFPVFINYIKDESISNTIKYEDRFLNDSILIALSKQKRTLNSPDVQTIYTSEKNGTNIYLFVRKNKDDSISKEFYFLGKITPIGSPNEIILNNTNSSAVEITYQLETPVREDLYEYITT